MNEKEEEEKTRTAKKKKKRGRRSFSVHSKRFNLKLNSYFCFCFNSVVEDLPCTPSLLMNAVMYITHVAI